MMRLSQRPRARDLANTLARSQHQLIIGVAADAASWFDRDTIWSARLNTDSEFENLVRRVALSCETPAAELRALLAHAPALAARLEELIGKRIAGQWLYPGEDNLLFYGLFVLAAARARNFWTEWARMLSQTEWTLSFFGDGAPESVASIALGLAGDAPEDIAALAIDPDLPEPARVGLLNALARLTCEGRFPRTDFLAHIDVLAEIKTSSDPEGRLWSVQEAIAFAGLWERLGLLEQLWALFPDGVVGEPDREHIRQATRDAARQPADMTRFDEAEITTPIDPLDGLRWLMRFDEHDPALDDALDVQERDWLSEFFQRNGAPQRFSSFEELDGFFHALVLGPELVLPSRYLPMILGEADAFDDEVRAHRLLALLQRHWNAIAIRNLEYMEPVLAIEPQPGQPPGRVWTQGFLRGVAMCADAWEELREDESAARALMQIAELAQADLDLSERYANLDALSTHVKELGEFCLALREPPTPRTVVKVGRNAPCPCGSGLKWKKCCAAPPPDRLH